MRTVMRRGVLLERDGVILRRRVKGCPSSWRDMEFLPRALDGLRMLAENDITVVVVSHQPCVSEGRVSSHELNALTRRMLLEVALAGGKIEKVHYCLHGERDKCFCKKPFPGLLLRAMAERSLTPAETWMIGEGDMDLEAAYRAGCRGILLRRDSFLTAGTRREDHVGIASSLYEAAQQVVQQCVPELEEVRRRKHTLPLSPCRHARNNFSTNEKEFA